MNKKAPPKTKHLPAKVRARIEPKTMALLRKIGRLAEERGEAAYAVGGFVRDLFLGRPGLDIDVTIEGDGVTFAEKLAEAAGAKVEAFSRFGTSIVVIPGFGKVDVATARVETYPRPGALPSVRKSGIEQDLYRRDFTLNSMALSLSPGTFLELRDPFHGHEDLRKGRIRALHSKSFEDDPTRVFRAVRFEQRFGKEIEPKTRRWLSAAVRGGSIRNVSGERLRNELRLIFLEPRPEKAVSRLARLGVLPKVHPALGVTPSARNVLPRVPGAVAFFGRIGIPLEELRMVWFQALLRRPDEREAAGICERLMLSRAEQKIVIQSARVFPSLIRELGRGNPPPSLIHKRLCVLRPEVKCFLLAAAGPALAARLRKYLSTIEKTEPWVKGQDLQGMGIPPGFRYSHILLEALSGQLDGKFKSRKAALDWVRRSFATEKSS